MFHFQSHSDRAYGLQLSNGRVLSVVICSSSPLLLLFANRLPTSSDFFNPVSSAVLDPQSLITIFSFKSFVNLCALGELSVALSFTPPPIIRNRKVFNGFVMSLVD